MDIKNYFSKTKSETYSTPNTSVLSSIRKEIQRESPSRSKSQSNKKRSDRLETRNVRNVNVDELVVELDSDGESPLPSSVKKSMASKRPKAYISSESEDDEDREKTSKATLIGKQRSKKARYGSDTEEKKKPSSCHVAGKKNSDREKMVIDGEDECELEEVVPKKKTKLLPKGQTTLSFVKASTSKSASSSSKRSSDVTPISTSDFFSGSSKSVSKSTEETKRTSSKISPSQKENRPSSRSEKKKVPDVPKSSIRTESKAKDNEISPKKSSERRTSASKSGDTSASKSSPTSREETRTKKTSDRSPVKKEVQKKHTKETPTKVRKHEKDEVMKKEKQKVTHEVKKDIVKDISKKVESSISVPWVDKYRPKSLAQLVGQHGDKSPVNKLLQWLKDWAKHNLGEGAKIKKPKPSPFASQSDGTAFKAALLSGSPGIGKTSSAHLVCESLGFKFVEMNASDVRNKKHLEAQIAQLTGSHQIEEYFGKKNGEVHSDDKKVHHVLVMDEVDGMSGNEDRAGIAELIQIIKDTKIPIICICNDRSHPKIRSLSNHCFDLRFPKPRVEQIRSRIMTIACQEKIKVGKEELDEIIELSAHDVRQTIYNLQMRGLGSEGDIQKKDCAINTFDAARRLLDSRATLNEKQEMFFVDYNIMPLFVQENYPNMKNENHSKLEAIRGLRKAAELISYGDVADKCLRTTGAWKLLNEQCMLGCALPSLAVGGHLKAMIQFPAWLGKNSTATKRQRMMRQLASHAQLKISASTHALVTDYVPVLRDRLTKPLLTDEANGVQAVIDVMTEYDLIKDDSEAIGELAVWPGKTDPASKIQSKVKAALTRALNKSSRLLPYALDDVSKGKKKKAGGATELELDEEGNLVERGLGEEDEEDEEENEEDEKAVAKIVTNTAAKSARGKATTRGRGGRGRGK